MRMTSSAFPAANFGKRMRAQVLLGWLLALAPWAVVAAGDSGPAGAVPAYGDAQLLAIAFKRMPDQAASALLARHSPIPIVYVSREQVNGRPFLPVISVVHGGGFLPFWEQIEIEFISGHAPRQFTSDVEVREAFQNGEIDLALTGEVYRGAAIGPRPEPSF